MATQHLTIRRFAEREIETLRRENRLGTARNYQKALASFTALLGGDVRLDCIDARTVGLYNARLVARGVVRNSISFYMRNLRALYNKAVRMGLVAQADPFREVYTGIDSTRKRAVDEAVVAQLARLNLPAGSATALARDMFVFSYCARGMAFVDVAYLKKSNIRGGEICYTRRKTGQRLYVRIEEPMARIIARYNRPESEYLFPIISSCDPEAAYAEYRAALNAMNRRLRALAARLDVPCRLTSYTSRHSWATAARRHDIPLPVISAALGHTSEQTTSIYLNSIDNSLIDTANRTLVAAVG